jgi:hypothetical protein
MLRYSEEIWPGTPNEPLAKRRRCPSFETARRTLQAAASDQEENQLAAAGGPGISTFTRECLFIVILKGDENDSSAETGWCHRL